MNADTRWIQRLNNYTKAFQSLSEAVKLSKTRELSDLEKQGLIQAFEYTHELAWNLLKDYLEYCGHVGLIGSRDSTREAFRRGLIEAGEIWMEMILSRNSTSHTYDEKLAETVLSDILNKYYHQFEILADKFTIISKE